MSKPGGFSSSAAASPAGDSSPVNARVSRSVTAGSGPTAKNGTLPISPAGCYVTPMTTRARIKPMIGPCGA